MKKTKKYLLLLISCTTLLLIGCNENNDVGTYSYEGVDYNKLTGLNAGLTGLYDVRDNEVYPVVELGGKYWLAENLRYDVTGSMLNPKNPSKKYGYLYDWNTAKMACPTGWHLSSDADWKSLEEALGMASKDLSAFGGRTLLKLLDLKASTGWENDNNGSNIAQFSMFPAGRHELGSFKNIEAYAFFWTSTLNTKNESIGRYVFHSSDQINRTYIDIDHSIGQSCRCVLN
jgi:uncharacterized protein (TIGR02145 family)